MLVSTAWFHSMLAASGRRYPLFDPEGQDLEDEDSSGSWAGPKGSKIHLHAKKPFARQQAVA